MIEHFRSVYLTKSKLVLYRTRKTIFSYFQPMILVFFANIKFHIVENDFRSISQWYRNSKK